MRNCLRILPIVLAATLAACAGPSQSVQRVDAKSTTDLSGKWNDTDARLTSEALIGQALSAGWLPSFNDEQGRKPSIRVRAIVNKTDEHIDAQVFIKSIERALLNSGKVKLLAQDNSELRSVEAEQDRGASGALSDETAPQLGNETGADYVVATRMASILDQIEGKKAKFYKINMELISPTTGEKAWIGDHEIKKVVSQKKNEW